MKNKIQEIIKHISTKEEFKNFNFEKVHDLQSLIDFLVEQDLLLVVDWQGEDETGDILTFISNRLDKNNIDFEFDDSKLNKIDTSKLEVGDFVIKQIKEYQKAVAKHKYVIADFYTHSDTYLLAVVKKTTLTKLKKIIIDDCFFRKFGATRNREVLYAIDCGKCGSPGGNWQLPINEAPPNEGQCYFCGANLFNEDGKPIYPMEVIPVP